MTETTEAQREFLRATMRGQVCTECGNRIAAGKPCQSCADKKALLREVFPKLHGEP